MSIIEVGNSMVTLPEGTDNSSVEGIKKTIHLFQFKHFITPLLAHSLGSLTGGVVAAWMAPINKLLIAIMIGVFFMIGGTVMVFQLPSPIWFNIIDLTFAYLPMAWIGHKMYFKFIAKN
tara:strand:- start:318 stop:674 length:357 start_codon:yes stop_codon:yes gene_type:complete